MAAGYPVLARDHLTPKAHGAAGISQAATHLQWLGSLADGMAALMSLCEGSLAHACWQSGHRQLSNDLRTCCLCLLIARQEGPAAGGLAIMLPCVPCSRPGVQAVARACKDVQRDCRSKAAVL